ncbi:MAG: hydratase [Patescibacteria group bacterium]
MIKLFGGKGVYLARGRVAVENAPGLTLAEINAALAGENLPPLAGEEPDPARDRTHTIAHGILAAHDASSEKGRLRLRFDALASHDITYVGIIQTARAGGLEEFPVPYVLTNCHNSLCAVGGTINEDDHLFGLSAAKKYGGIFVPAHLAVIHQYMREMHAGGGTMILGSDSHTRYGALGTMGVGEGGPELVKQLLGRTYDLDYPEVIAVCLDGAPRPGVGPMDVALAIIQAVYTNGFVKNKVMEFVGPGVASLPVDFRNGVDVMTTETACLSSIWRTDEKVRAYLARHGRGDAHRLLEPGDLAYYDGMIRVDLGRVEPMIALPFHPSNAFPISELNRNPREILAHAEAEARRQLDNPRLSFSLTEKLADGRLRFDQGVVAGCAGGTYANLRAVAEMLAGRSIGGHDFNLSVYPASQPVNLALVRDGAAERLILAGATLRTAFCGPCFGAGDVPANGGLSARHTTRNFPNREGSKPGQGQLAAVALMDARSIAATALHGGRLTSALEMEPPAETDDYAYDAAVYTRRVYFGFGLARREEPLRFGPNIADWPRMEPLPEDLALEVVSVIHDPVTTTDELIPSGETSSYRSNPLRLAEFTLSRKDPGYVARAKAVQAMEAARREDRDPALPGLGEIDWRRTGLGSAVVARKPGDGSAREQAASSQRVLGGLANIALEYATKRYRSNLVNWGMLPFTADGETFAALAVGDWIHLAGIRRAIADGAEEIEGMLIRDGRKQAIRLKLPGLAAEEREIILAGCLINHYAQAKLAGA